MSDALIASLQKQVTDLTNENAGLKAEAKDRRIKNAKLNKEIEELRGLNETVTKERDEFKVKAEAAPADLTKQIGDLQGQLRSRDHRDAFSSVKEFAVKGEDGTEAKYTLNDGVSVDDLWTGLGYKPEGDIPDQARITGILSEGRASKPYLFKPSEGAGAPQSLPQPRREPGPGNGTRPQTGNAAPPSVRQQVLDDYASSGRRQPGRL